MRTPERMSRLAIAMIAAGLLFVSANLSRAEVAVVLDAGSATPTQPIAVYTIVDDSEPQGSRWERFNSDSESRIALNDDGFTNGDGSPSVLFRSPDRIPMVAWAQNSPGGFDVVFSTFVDGAWSSPFTLAGSPDDELDPVLLRDPATGSIHLFYWILDGAPRVMHRQAPADLSSWSAPTRVSQLGEVASRPSAAFHQGALLVVYESHGVNFGALPRHVVLATADGVGYSFETLSNSQHSDPNWPRIHSAGGRLWVDWIDTAGEMCWTRQVSPGQWDPLQYEPFSSTVEMEFHTRQQIKEQVLE